MNAIEAGFIKAGLKVPTLMERAWRFVRENPGCTSKEVSVAIGRAYGTASGLLWQMEHRGMAHSKVDTTHKHKACRYYTDMDVYKLLPKPKKPAAQPKATTPAPKQSATPAPTTHVQAAPAPKLERKPVAVDIDSLTVREARELYTQLHQLFGQSTIAH